MPVTRSYPPKTSIRQPDIETLQTLLRMALMPGADLDSVRETWWRVQRDLGRDVGPPPRRKAYEGAPDEILRPDQVGELLNMHEKTVRRLLGKGELPGVQLGNQWRCSRAQILAILDKRQ